VSIADPGTLLHELRAIKSDDEIDTLRRAAEITRNGHVAAMRATRPGLHEYELKALLEYEYVRGGARGVAYESIVAAGDNATILHYVTCRDRLEPGALLLVDSGCELDYYASDVTRTWPVDGRFTPNSERSTISCWPPRRLRASKFGRASPAMFFTTLRFARSLPD